MEKIYLLGIDIGSTTVKSCLLDDSFNVLFSKYARHSSLVKEESINQIKEIKEKFGDIKLKVYLTGSAGLGLSERSDLPFVQEVQSAFVAINKFYPQADCAIELGGEDAKIIFITGGLEERMNGQCAGGTGAFIDQMATLLNVSVKDLDNLSANATKSYAIASRCGVFAKSDIQALLNQGATKEDIAKSIFYAVADQTIAGLAQGREIKGNVLFLGGPLYFMSSLRKAFRSRLDLSEENAIYPDDAQIFMAKGAALFANKAGEITTIGKVLDKLVNAKVTNNVITGIPLFKDQKEYDDFINSHEDFDIKREDITKYEGDAYLGIDAGSTTTKVILIGKDNQILYEHYDSNKGIPIENIIAQLKNIYNIKNDKCNIVSSAVTGYGEELIKSALGVDYGLVETVAHFKAATYYCPDVDFVLDIGGQDIKCFKIKNHAIDSIMLNEACSSGCGSFLQTFAKSLDYDIEDFAKLGYFSKNPIELGSRCTVFMNSSVKQAQREGASTADISAGLSKSVVKNALYKVIRVNSAAELGNNIVTQGGTFLNNAVLRSFEQEIGKHVIRPSIAGLMGAFGAALYAKEKGGTRNLITKDNLDNFTYTQLHTTCKGCGSNCSLSILKFPGGKSFISGNKCDKPEGKNGGDTSLDIEAFKKEKLGEYKDIINKNDKPTVGIPLVLLMYEQLPLWHHFFDRLGFNVVISPFSTRKLYRDGQKTIPSDTACYPAKLFHGHVDYLLKQNVDFIFYPSETYNINENRGDNHFNCPVVAYYGELMKKNDLRLNDNNFIDPFIELPSFKKSVESLYESLKKYNVNKKDIKDALQESIDKYYEYRKIVKEKGKEIINKAREQNKLIICLVGRPYHTDPEVNHGIDKLLDSLGVAVISEDSLIPLETRTKTEVLNQWTYHARLYDAAKIVSLNKDMELVHLVSFGCGVDAITSDETRRILEDNGRLYTQIKIDEINNLGAIKIRLRSLLAAVERRNER